MNRTKNSIYNSLGLGFYQLTLMISGFIIPYIVLNYYGSEVNGLVSSISQFIFYFSLVEAGLSTAAIYTLYKPLAQKSYDTINSTIAAARIFYKKAGYLFFALVIILMVTYPFLVNSTIFSKFDIALMVLILGMNGVFEISTLAKYRVLLTADQKTYIISFASIIQIVLSTLIFTLLGMNQINILLVRFIILFTILIRSSILYIYTKRNYPYIDYKASPNFDSLKNRWNALYLQILGVIQFSSPIIILTIVTGDLKIISVYTVFNMIVGAINGMLSIFISALSASFGDIIARKEQFVLEKSYSEFEFIHYNILAFLYSITFLTIMPFISLYTTGITDINYNIPIIGLLFIINGMLYNFKTPQSTIVISSGLFKETRLQTTIQGLIVVLVGLILAFKFNIIGVLIASILSNLYRLIDLVIYTPKHITKLRVRHSLYRISKTLLIIFVICFPPYFIDFQYSNYIDWSINALILSIYAIIIIIIINILFDRKLLSLVLYRIKEGLSKR